MIIQYLLLPSSSSGINTFNLLTSYNIDYVILRGYLMPSKSSLDDTDATSHRLTYIYKQSKSSFCIYTFKGTAVISILTIGT